MNTRMQTDAWICRIVVVLGLILVASVAVFLGLMRMGQLIPEILLALGSVAIGGLIQLWISPLNQKLLE